MDIIDQILGGNRGKRYANSKGGYVEPGKVVLNAPLTDGANYDVAVTGNELAAGETYIVVTDSGTFTAACVANNGGVFIGNVSLLGVGDNTGESFVVAIGEDNGAPFCVCIDSNGGSHITVTTPETIHPIDPKFLPGVCLPVVELTGCTSGEAITDENVIATLNQYAQNVTPAVLGKVAANGNTTFAMLAYTSADGLVAYCGVAGAASVILEKSGEVWQFYMSGA